ncbi:MAG: hypothetical protein ACOYOU_06300 [Kiritimatiellia bacterium]
MKNANHVHPAPATADTSAAATQPGVWSVIGPLLRPGSWAW